MLVNDVQEIRNVWVLPQLKPLRIQIKSSVKVGAVFVSLNLVTSLREEVGFQSNSVALNTHNSSIQEGIKPWCM